MTGAVDQESARQISARSIARRCLKPLFTRPVSPEQREACDNVTAAIADLMRCADENEAAWRKTC